MGSNNENETKRFNLIRSWHVNDIEVPWKNLPINRHHKLVVSSLQKTDRIFPIYFPFIIHNLIVNTKIKPDPS